MSGMTGLGIVIIGVTTKLVYDKKYNKAIVFSIVSLIAYSLLFFAATFAFKPKLVELEYHSYIPAYTNSVVIELIDGVTIVIDKDEVTSITEKSEE